MEKLFWRARGFCWCMLNSRSSLESWEKLQEDKAKIWCVSQCVSGSKTGKLMAFCYSWEQRARKCGVKTKPWVHVLERSHCWETENRRRRCFQEKASKQKSWALPKGDIRRMSEWPFVTESEREDLEQGRLWARLLWVSCKEERRHSETIETDSEVLWSVLKGTKDWSIPGDIVHVQKYIGLSPPISWHEGVHL